MLDLARTARPQGQEVVESDSPALDSSRDRPIETEGTDPETPGEPDSPADPETPVMQDPEVEGAVT
jgi:hypothetical protein